MKDLINRERLKRVVKCPSCGQVKESNEPNPKCEKCHWSMFVVVGSIMPKEDK